MTRPIRKTSQHLIPAAPQATQPGLYDIYPGHPLGNGQVEAGYDALARQVARAGTVIIDGFVGVDWSEVRTGLDAALRKAGINAAWRDINDALLPESAIETMVAPFLGGDDPLFGTRFTGSLPDFFDRERLASIHPDPAAPLSILHGCGASLAGWQGLHVYIDIPKNEIQFRSRAGAVCNLGRRGPDAPKPQYKRFYFVDWPVLNAHKAALLPRVDLFVDGQRPDHPMIARGTAIRRALGQLATSCFRVRPWFEPGPWGGQWIRERIPGLATDVPNYAWSFELIVPENGLLFESDGRMLELSFDSLMFQEGAGVLGHSFDRFRHEFPIRFDFLDTIGGGNLSLQCHPGPEYIRRHFGETYTQDETYYILDCKPGAEVYLGFREGVTLEDFRGALDKSCREATPLDVRRHVNVEPAKKHDLFLIPNGTIHCSGTDNMVLEISATPYIFTFKMYDWQRMDLDGRPRPLNIDRAMENLHFERQGAAARHELVSQPRVLSESPAARLVHLPTHREHFYDVHRFEIATMVEATTDGSPHVCSLVEGETIFLETADGTRRRFNYAETFVIPAAAERYRLVTEDGHRAKVVKAFMKPGFEFS